MASDDHQCKTGTEQAAALAAGLSGAQAASTAAAQTDALVAGLADMAKAAEHLGNKSPEFLKGDLFEYIEVAKFNADVAARDPSLVAKLTRDMGAPGSPVDIIIERNGTVVREAQAKASQGTKELTGYLRDPKYHGMQKVVPSDKAAQVQERADFRARCWTKRGNEGLARENADTARNVTGELHAGRASSGGTTNAELDLAKTHPKLYRLRTEARYVAGEAGVAAGRAALTGAVVGGALSVVRNGISVAKGDATIGEAGVAVAKDTTTAAAKSAVVGASGAVVRYGASRAGVQALAKSNVATAVAAGVVEVGVSVYRYARGEISGEQAAEQIGQTGCSTMAGIYAGAAAGMLFGPAGAIVGSIAGYLTATQVYQSSIVILRRARLAVEEAERVEALCADAIRGMVAMRAEVEHRVTELVGERQAALEQSLAFIDEGLDVGSAALTIAGLSRLAESCGRTLQLESFEEFDNFMLNSSEPLRF